MIAAPYYVIGLMSGTSLDGVDLVGCQLLPTDTHRWEYQLLAATTLPLPTEWLRFLSGAQTEFGAILVHQHFVFGRYLGDCIRDFTRALPFQPHFAASHGHTIFHEPTEKGLTFQLGHGAPLAAAAGLPVVCDFRTTDVALGGQGAPLVPLGDRLLFGEYGGCLNLGGIANLSVETAAGRLAYDVCACNQLFNALAAEAGLPYDADGQLARTGQVDAALLAALDAPAYFRQPAPKSLGREWVERHALPLLQNRAVPLPDRLRTAVRHVAGQLATAIGQALAATPATADRRVLTTGGGAFNGLLLDDLRSLLGPTAEIVVPDAELVNFKEALVFALLGTLRWREEVNCLASVTGARHDNVGGAIYLP